MLEDRLTPVVKILLLLNIGIFLLANLIGFGEVYSFMSLKYFESPNFQPYQFVTHMFMHHDLMHLFSNMFGIFMFGPMLEKVWGPKRFLTFYMICGLGAAAFYMGINTLEIRNTYHKIEVYNQNPNPNSFELIMAREFKGYYDPNDKFYTDYRNSAHDTKTINYTKEVLNDLYKSKINMQVVGASGALFGILLAFGMLFPNTTLMLLFFPVPIKAKYFVALYGVWELYAGFQRTPGDNVAHFAHLGGMIFGFLLIVYWKRNRNSFY